MMGVRILSCLFALSLLVLACGSDRADPISPGGSGSLSPGAGRANLAVVDSIMHKATQIFFEDIRFHFAKAIGGITTYSDTSQSVRILGNHNGYALVRALHPDSAAIDTSAAPDVEVEYINFYSETGRLFYVGKLELYGEWRKIGGVDQLYKFDLKGTVDVSGDYACLLTFEAFRMALNPDGTVLDMLAAIEAGPTYSLPHFGTVVITSGSQTVRFSPYLFDYGPD
jgi:hypothetical protein